MAFNRLIFLGILVAVLGGCPRPPPLDFGTSGRITDPAIVFEAVQARRAKVDSVQGEAKANVETKDGSGKLTQFVVAESPDRLRLESISFFGNPIAVMTSDGDLFRLHDLEGNRFYEGPASAANVSRLLPIRLPPTELVSLLLGVPPLLDRAEPRRLEVDDQRRAYVLQVAAGSDRQELGLDPKTLRPLWTRFGERGLLSGYLAEFEEYEGDADLPRIVRLSSDDGKTKVALSWRERAINPKLDQALFTLAPPEGVARIQTGAP